MQINLINFSDENKIHGSDCGNLHDMKYGKFQAENSVMKLL